MAFQPAQLRVARGDTIVWINRDFVPHTAAITGTWDTGTIEQGDSAVTVVSGHSGMWHCAFHPTMEGTLTLR